MSQDVTASWEKFLNPESLKRNLVAAGIYLTAYELLKESIIKYPKDIFSEAFRDGEFVLSPKYQSEVRALDDDALTASCLWWKSREVLTDDDIARVKTIRAHRHELAHEMPRFLATAEASVRLELLTDLAAVVRKIDQWWILEVEIPTNPEFDGRTLTEEERLGVASMRMIMLDLLVPLSKGDDSQLQKIYTGWHEAVTKQRDKTL